MLDPYFQSLQAPTVGQPGFQQYVENMYGDYRYSGAVNRHQAIQQTLMMADPRAQTMASTANMFMGGPQAPPPTAGQIATYGALVNSRAMSGMFGGAITDMYSGIQGGLNMQFKTSGMDYKNSQAALGAVFSMNDYFMNERGGDVYQRTHGMNRGQLGDIAYMLGGRGQLGYQGGGVTRVEDQGGDPRYRMKLGTQTTTGTFQEITQNLGQVPEEMLDQIKDLKQDQTASILSSQSLKETNQRIEKAAEILSFTNDVIRSDKVQEMVQVTEQLAGAPVTSDLGRTRARKVFQDIKNVSAAYGLNDQTVLAAQMQMSRSGAMYGVTDNIAAAASGDVLTQSLSAHQRLNQTPGVTSPGMQSLQHRVMQDKTQVLRENQSLVGAVAAITQAENTGQISFTEAERLRTQFRGLHEGDFQQNKQSFYKNLADLGLDYTAPLDQYGDFETTMASLSGADAELVTGLSGGVSRGRQLDIVNSQILRNIKGVDSNNRAKILRAIDTGDTKNLSPKEKGLYQAAIGVMGKRDETSNFVSQADQDQAATKQWQGILKRVRPVGSYDSESPDSFIEQAMQSFLSGEDAVPGAFLDESAIKGAEGELIIAEGGGLTGKFAGMTSAERVEAMRGRTAMRTREGKIYAVDPSKISQDKRREASFRALRAMESQIEKDYSKDYWLDVVQGEQGPRMQIGERISEDPGSYAKGLAHRLRGLSADTLQSLNQNMGGELGNYLAQGNVKPGGEIEEVLGKLEKKENDRSIQDQVLGLLRDILKALE